MNCRKFREISDSYLGDELLVETNHEVLRHLEDCPACRRKLAAERNLQSRVRSAVKNAPDAQINPIFVRRLEASLHQTASRPSVWAKIKNGVFINSPVWAMAATACVLFGVLFGAAFWLRRAPAPGEVAARQTQSNESVENSRPAKPNAPQIVKAAWREAAGAAVGDHENCALHFRLKEEPIPLDQAAEKYGKFNKDLDKAVIAAIRDNGFNENEFGKTMGKMKFTHAHSCVFEGRRFAHVILQNGKKTISVLVAEADLTAEDDDAVTNQSEGNIQAAGFLHAHHRVFVVSDLTEAENTLVAQTISPAVRRHLEQTQAKA